MKYNRRIVFYIIWSLAGAGLFTLGITGVVDDFWQGMGVAMIAVSILRLARIYRYHRDEEYREQTNIAASDERNRFIRNKAWAWAGYYFIVIAGISVIVLKLLGQELLCFAASWAVCLLLVLYWIAYLILRKKY